MNKTMRARVGAFCCLIAGLGPLTITSAHAQVPVQSAPQEGWVKLGASQVDGKLDRDILTVGGRDGGGFSAIQLKVEGSAVAMFDIKVVFGNGETFEPKTRLIFNAGTTSRSIDLPGDKRVIQRVEFRYGELPGGGKARVELWGQMRPASHVPLPRGASGNEHGGGPGRGEGAASGPRTGGVDTGSPGNPGSAAAGGNKSSGGSTARDDGHGSGSGGSSSSKSTSAGSTSGGARDDGHGSGSAGSSSSKATSAGSSSSGSGASSGGSKSSSAGGSNTSSGASTGRDDGHGQR